VLFCYESIPISIIEVIVIIGKVLILLQLQTILIEKTARVNKKMKIF